MGKKKRVPARAILMLDLMQGSRVGVRVGRGCGMGIVGVGQPGSTVQGGVGAGARWPEWEVGATASEEAVALALSVA